MELNRVRQAISNTYDIHHEVFEYLQKSVINISCVLYGTFLNFINTIMRLIYVMILAAYRINIYTNLLNLYRTSLCLLN